MLFRLLTLHLLRLLFRFLLTLLLRALGRVLLLLLAVVLLHDRVRIHHHRVDRRAAAAAVTALAHRVILHQGAPNQQADQDNVQNHRDDDRAIQLIFLLSCISHNSIPTASRFQDPAVPGHYPPRCKIKTRSPYRLHVCLRYAAANPLNRLRHQSHGGDSGLM